MPLPKMNPLFTLFLSLITLTTTSSLETTPPTTNSATTSTESQEFLAAHNLVRAKKLEVPLIWDGDLERYARWWAGQRSGDCRLQHSFPDGGFELGENIFWGGGSRWSPRDAVEDWAEEEKYYDYGSNTCAEGEMCGHYTQIVWSSTRRVGCARVVCQDEDVFITCNYYPPGNFVGQRPY